MKWTSMASDKLEEAKPVVIWWVYMIRCGDGSLYTGIATDVARRFAEHESQGPKGAKYTRGKMPLELVFRKEIGSRSEACKEELRIKALTRRQKLALISSSEGG
ncbi:GIY-YIG nuclease family protein [Roseibacillus persicicus]|uniref:GIY-YIG nuclease family protein n=1 Tax=Roseibacillus persicicus TaxID=454148 RepID=UPI002811E5FA|nr:GIY-YIG nuclease family protein [Roseibacillus persicicus]